MLNQLTAETGVYCPIAGQIAAISTDGRRCTGIMLVTGDGLGGKEDVYGEKYRRRCFTARRFCEMVIVRVGDKVAEEEGGERVTVGRLGAGGPDRAQFPSEPE